MRFLTADYVFPIFSLPVQGGILVVEDNGRIKDLLDPARIDYAIPGLESYSGFLCPGFINTHCHLELAWAKNLMNKGLGLDNFLKELDSMRKEIGQDDVIAAIHEEGEEMIRKGVVAVGDISNNTDSFSYKQVSKMKFHTFVEVFGSDPAFADIQFNKVNSVYREAGSLLRNNKASITPHATYSLSPELFRLVADHAAASKSVLSIHHQESLDENSYFMDGTGRIADRRKFFNPGIKPFQPTGLSPVESIAGYFTPEQKMILVHNTVSKESDLSFAQNYFRQLFWCLCPNANLFIENKLPDIDLFRKTGCSITLGTDSLASNSTLSILDEIKTIQSHYPAIPLSEALKWATSNGAEVLGFEQLGSFDKGRGPGVVLLENVDNENQSLLPESSSRLLMMPTDESIY